MRSSLALLVLVGVIATVPVCCMGLFLAQNEHAWMSSDGNTVPPDCDIAAADGFLSAAFGVSLAVVLLFGRRAWSQRARLLVAAVAIAALMLLAIGAHAPGYLAERSRAQELCSKIGL
jgi:hypothetical protein